MGVNRVLARLWSPSGLWRRLKTTIRRPSDIIFALQLGCFVWRVPSDLGANHLSHLLDGLKAKPRPPARSVDESLERIMRLSQPWLRLSCFQTRNTCYLRALTLYRFLDAGEGDLRIHFVVEPARTAEERLRGHAWVTVDGRVLDVIDPTLIDRSREIYSYPPVRS